MLELPHALVQSINKACKKEGCTSQELIRVAISKMLFEQSRPSPDSEMLVKKTDLAPNNSVTDASYEIPLDRIIAVRYTLDDGKIIHIMRGKKSSQT